MAVKKRCTLVVAEGQVKVLIHGLPHIVLRQSELVGFHSWIDGYEKEQYVQQVAEAIIFLVSKKQKDESK